MVQIACNALFWGALRTAGTYLHLILNFGGGKLGYVIVSYFARPKKLRKLKKLSKDAKKRPKNKKKSKEKEFEFYGYDWAEFEEEEEEEEGDGATHITNSNAWWGSDDRWYRTEESARVHHEEDRNVKT